MKNITVKILIFSIVISAILGILVIVLGAFGDFELRVLLTSLCVSGSSVLIVPCALARERRRLTVLAPLGALASAIGFGMFIAAIWMDDIYDEDYWRTAFSLIIAAASIAHVSLLFVARLAARFRWVTSLGALASLTLAGQWIFLIWGGDVESIWFFRLFGVLVILIAATTLAVPILHLITRMSEPAGRGFPIHFCPGCGAALAADFGAVECVRCGATYTIGTPD